MSWFVVLRGQDGRPLPMTDDEERLALFFTEKEAEVQGEAHMLGRAYGFEVYEW